MKQLLLLNIILAALSTPLQAAPIVVKAVATDVLGTYGSFSQTPDGTALGDNDIKTIISSDPATAIYGLSNPVPETNPQENWVSIDLGFGNNTVVTGSGVDLVIFSQTSGYDYSFGLQAFDTNNNLLSSYNYSTGTHSSIFSPGILTTSIDLFDGNGTALGDDIELGYISLFIGNDYNGTSGGIDAYSNFSLVGAVHTQAQAAVVPLPLSIVLFSSGLALLGWIGRKRAV